MKLFRQALFAVVILSVIFAACNDEKKNVVIDRTVTVKGLYSFGPDMRSFTNCDDGREYWVADSVKNLELQYSKQGFEKPYEPVYVELEGYYIKSNPQIAAADYDSTIVVTKLLKLTKQIPDGPCAQ